jgi:2-polyprenyl-3-methyl-5-hydroxy-6-metoxy-1,4-benzoquinol methylase
MIKNNSIKENIYGHAKRLEWIKSHIQRSNTILEFGCGTGYMITLPLAKMGYTITGIDSDEASISYGRKIFEREGIDPNKLKTTDLNEIDIMPDVIIASEVFEHISDDNLRNILAIIRAKLKPGGKLLLTVPNGYGWFEMESFLWYKAGFGILIDALKIDICIKRLKFFVFGSNIEDMTPSSLAHSPHVQKFTYKTIHNRLRCNGFNITEATGSVLFCGPFSNMLFTGVKPIMKFNALMGSVAPKLSSAFYIVARIANEQEQG